MKEENKRIIPKEDLTLFMNFNAKEYNENKDSLGLYFDVSNKIDDDCEPYSFDNLTDESLMLLANCLVVLLEDFIEPELDKRYDKKFSKDVNEEIEQLLKSTNLKDGNDDKGK